MWLIKKYTEKHQEDSYRVSFVAKPIAIAIDIIHVYCMQTCRYILVKELKGIERNCLHFVQVLYLKLKKYWLTYEVKFPNPTLLSFSFRLKETFQLATSI